MADRINYMGQPIPSDGLTAAPQTTAPTDPTAGLLALLAKALAPQPQQDLSGLLAQLRNDPQGDANKGYIPGVSNASSPFSNGFFNDSAASMSPEGRMATQGRSAMNQWAQQGAVPGVDASALQSLMGQMTPLPGPQATPSESFSDPFFMRRKGIGPYSADNQFDGMFQQGPGMRANPKTGETPYGFLGQSELPPGIVAGDGTTNYKRSNPDLFFGMVKPKNMMKPKRR